MVTGGLFKGGGGSGRYGSPRYNKVVTGILVTDKVVSSPSYQVAGASTGGDLEAACFHLGSGGGGIKSPPEDFFEKQRL